MTPARLNALAVLGLVGLVFASALGACDELEWQDPTDSVQVLSQADACRIAQRDLLNADAQCTLMRANREYAELAFGPRDAPMRVCFLKGARWFIVGSGWELKCPTTTPGSGHVGSLEAEFTLEERWKKQTLQHQPEQELQGFHERLARLVGGMRVSSPGLCPTELPTGSVEALDVDLVVRGEAKIWHYLSSERAESLFGSISAWRISDELRDLRNRSPLLLLVDASEKREPLDTQPGLITGRVALVDWTREKVLCVREYAYTQPEDAPRDRSAMSPLLPNFKQRISESLAAVLREMTNDQLELVHTF